MKYIRYASAEQPINKHFLQMQKNILDRDCIGCVMENVVITDEGGYCQMFFSEDDITRLHEDGEKLLQVDAAQKSLKAQAEAADNYWKAADSLLSAIKGEQKREEIAELYDSYSVALRRVYANFVTTIEHVIYAIDLKLKEILKEKLGEQWEEGYVTLTSSCDEDLLFREITEWRKVIRNPLQKDILAHYSKYSILLANVLSEKEALEIANKRLKEKTHQQIDIEIKEYKDNKAKLRLKQGQLLAQIHSKDAGQISFFLSEGSRIRLLLKACWNGEAFHMLPFFEFIAKLAKCSVKDAYMFYTSDEVSRLLHTGLALPKNVLEQRKDFCLLQIQNKTVTLFNGNEAYNVKRDILDTHLPGREMTTLSGSVAYRGLVKGVAKVMKVDNSAKVRVISENLDSDTDYILVVGMTNPAMVPLITKVKGIVTDEGGITCHAAVISREFKIPCIVGTKYATHIFSDGDLLEVDANKGIVRRLN